MDLIQSQYELTSSESEEEDEDQKVIVEEPMQTETQLEINDNHFKEESCKNEEDELKLKEEDDLKIKIESDSSQIPFDSSDSESKEPKIKIEPNDSDSHSTIINGLQDVCTTENSESQTNENMFHSSEGEDKTKLLSENLEGIVSSNPDSFVKIQIKEEPESEFDTDLSISDSESLDSSEISDNDIEEIKKKKRKPPKLKGEMSFDDLPPIEDLQISVPADDCKPIGTVKSFVDPLVIVEGHQYSPALDIDSVLFIEEGGRALGHVFDVFGPVSQPHYCVRFNSKDHIEAKGIKIGMPVYCAPKTVHSTFVLLAQLEKLKGSDSSWQDDHETPIDEMEFSDDEKEMEARRRQKGSINENNEADKEKKQRKKLKARKSRPNVNPNAFIPPQVPGFRPFYQNRHFRPRVNFPPSNHSNFYQHPPPPPPPPPQFNNFYPPPPPPHQNYQNHQFQQYFFHPPQTQMYSNLNYRFPFPPPPPPPTPPGF